MKKVLALLMTATMFISLSAQKKVVNNAESLMEKNELAKAYETIQPALTNDETKDQPNTWFVKAQILQKIAVSPDSVLKKSFENAPKEAFETYKKVNEVDVKKKFDKKVNMQMEELARGAAVYGSEAYGVQNYAKALEMFELFLEIYKNPVFNNFVDTSMIFNCGIAANNAKNYDKAIEYFKKAADYKYNGGVTFSLLKSAYLSKGDSAQALVVLKQGFELFPNDLTLIVDLVNYYLVGGQAQEALNYLNMAKQKDPNNTSFYFAEGTLYEKINDIDKAVAAYLKASEIDPKNFNAYYNLGVVYYNNAVKIFDKASSEKDDAKYNELNNQGNEELKKSIPWLEKAHSIDPKEETCAKTLKGLYFRMQMTDKLNAINQEMGW